MDVDSAEWITKVSSQAKIKCLAAFLADLCLVQRPDARDIIGYLVPLVVPPNHHRVVKILKVI